MMLAAGEATSRDPPWADALILLSRKLQIPPLPATPVPVGYSEWNSWVLSM